MKLILMGLVVYALSVTSVALVELYRFDDANQRIIECEQALNAHGKFKH